MSERVANPERFETPLARLSAFALAHGHQRVVRREEGQWRYYEPAPGEPFDALTRVCEVDDPVTGQPRMMHSIVHTGTGIARTGLLAELLWCDEDPLPDADEDVEMYMPQEHMLTFRQEGYVQYDRFVLDPTGTRHGLENYRLDDQQMDNLDRALETIRTA